MNLPSLFGAKNHGKTGAPENGNTPNVSPAVTVLSQGTTNVKDIIAPEAIEVDWSDVKINDTYYRTLFVAGYPRFVNANWLSPLVNFPHSLSISMFIYPVDGKGVIEDLRRKIAEVREAGLTMERDLVALEASVREAQGKLALLKEDQKKATEGEIEKMKNELLEYDRQKKTDLTKERNEKIREILLEIEKIVSGYAEQNGYSVILNDRVLIYADKGLDLTENILKNLNAKKPEK